jgi:hypothetical protein
MSLFAFSTANLIGESLQCSGIHNRQNVEFHSLKVFSDVAE